MSTVSLYDIKPLAESAGYDTFKISGKVYDPSFRFYCGANPPPPQLWETGGFKRVRSLVGIADDDKSASGAIGRVTIKNQDGVSLVEPFEISLGKPVTLDFELHGAVQMQIQCIGRDVSTGKSRYGFYGVLAEGVMQR